MAFIFLKLSTSAQSCPDNIDFENGTFGGWTCYTGFTSALGTTNVISLSPSGGPISNVHTMYPPNSQATDYFGGFSVHSPNGSGYSVKLGNTTGGGQAEGISYEFTIPDNQDSYLLTYWYAVVFQAPHHRENEQPRMETEITNVTDNRVISCASLTFIAFGTSIPGFEVSEASDSIEVLYKKWTAVSVDLSGNAGKRIRLFFKTADCTFKRHFGYAYLDVSSECSGNLAGAAFCPDDTVVNVVAPYGYGSYTWYDNSSQQVLGTEQTLNLSPPPVSGTTLAVKLEPFSGYGCSAIKYTRLTNSLTITADAGKDALSCNGDTLQLGTVPKEGLVYKWSPAEGLSDPHIANPFFIPGVSANYVVTTSSWGGGCSTTDTVKVIAAAVTESLQLLGKDAYCSGHGDSAVLKVKQAHRIEWYKDDVPVNEVAGQTTYRINFPGTYFAVLTDVSGCITTTQKKLISIDYDKAGIAYPEKYALVNFPLKLTARPIGQTVSWNPVLNLDDPESFDPNFKGAGEQLYTIVIKTKQGCITTDTQLVKLVQHAEIYVPAAFTPNSDGKNDYLHPVCRGISQLRSFRIFNRWGQLLFTGKGELPGWDGSFKGLSQVPQAVVWILEYVGLDGKIYSQSGSSVLVR